MAVWRFVDVTATDADGVEIRLSFNTIKSGPSLWHEAAARAEKQTSRRIETITIIEPHYTNRS